MGQSYPYSTYIKLRSPMTGQRLNYISILSIANDIRISLYYEEAIEEYADKNVEKKVL